MPGNVSSVLARSPQPAIRGLSDKSTVTMLLAMVAEPTTTPCDRTIISARCDPTSVVIRTKPSELQTHITPTPVTRIVKLVPTNSIGKKSISTAHTPGNPTYTP